MGWKETLRDLVLLKRFASWFSGRTGRACERMLVQSSAKMYRAAAKRLRVRTKAGAYLSSASMKMLRARLL